jgi:hypothetical protein
VLLIDCEEDRTLRAVLVGMLPEVDRNALSVYRRRPNSRLHREDRLRRRRASSSRLRSPVILSTSRWSMCWSGSVGTQRSSRNRTSGYSGLVPRPLTPRTIRPTSPKVIGQTADRLRGGPDAQGGAGRDAAGGLTMWSHAHAEPALAHHIQALTYL